MPKPNHDDILDPAIFRMIRTGRSPEAIGRDLGVDAAFVRLRISVAEVEKANRKADEERLAKMWSVGRSPICCWTLEGGYCDAPSAEGASYCPEHAARAYIRRHGVPDAA